MKNGLLLFSFLLFFSSLLKSQVYVDQITGNIDQGGRPAQYFPDFGFCPIETADDFTVPSGSTWNIDSVFTEGSFSTGFGSSSFDTVIVTFFNDNSGMPGNSFIMDTIILDSTNTDNKLEVVLTNTIQLSAGTYWISVDAVMPFNNGLPPGGQWFQGAYGATPTGNEWYLRDPCDLFATGITAWQSATSQGSAVSNLMFMLKSGPCSITSDTTVTITDAVLSSNQPNASYQWLDCSSNNLISGAINQSYNATSNGSYACIITNGCATDTSSCQQINCINSINNNIAVSNNNLHAMDSSASYQWFDCTTGNTISGANSQVYTVTQTGSYACALINGCAADTTSCINIIINGIDQNFLNNNINVYPNPTSQYINIETGNLKLNQIKIFTLTGELVLQPAVTSKSIDLSPFSNGIYIIQLETDSAIRHYKIVKE
jgi:hypothetical protein